MTQLRLVDGRVNWREVDGELIALERGESVYLAGNQSATILWRALAEGSSPEALAELLVDTYAIPAAAARGDVSRFLDDLRARGVLQVA